MKTRKMSLERHLVLFLDFIARDSKYTKTVSNEAEALGNEVSKMLPAMVVALRETLPVLQDHQNKCSSPEAARVFLKVKEILGEVTGDSI